MENTPPDLKRERRRRPAGEPAPDRLPPHAPEAEQGALGSALLDAATALPVLLEKFKAGGEEFYDLRHQTIYEALLALYDERSAIDVITLQQRLKDKQLLEQVGGIAYLSQLPDCVPSAANVAFYADIMVDKYLLRKTIHVCTDVVARCYDFEGESAQECLDEVQTKVNRLGNFFCQNEHRSAKELVKCAINKIEQMHQNAGQITGIASGFADLDRMTMGFQPGEMIVIAARPSMGKTSLAMNMAEHVAIDLGLPTGVFSLEMTAESLMLRLLCCRARINLRNVRDGFLAERDFPKLTSAAGKISHAPLFIEDQGGLSILQLRAKARRMAQQYGIKFLVIDYLQLLHSTSRKADNRQSEVADISSGIKSLAKELGIPVVVLAQLNRELEKDKSRKPRMSDLRESGAIEQDADLIGLLYKPEESPEDQPIGPNGEELVVPVNLLIAKQRNGPTGDVKLTFLKSITRFESAAKFQEADVPPQASFQYEPEPANARFR